MKKLIVVLVLNVVAGCAPKEIVIGENSKFLEKEITELEEYIDKSDVINEEVSEVPVKWHIEHTLLTIRTIYDTMETSDPSDFKNRPNLVRMMMFSGNEIPRGRATAPESVRPKDTITKKTIQTAWNRSEAVRPLFDALNANSFFKHPNAGYLNRVNSKRFLKIHTEHHLKIIRDILNNTGN